MDGCFGAWTIVLGIAQIVVGAHVKGLLEATGVVVGPIVVIRFAFNQVDGCTGYTANGTVEAVSDSCVNVAGVEALIALVKRTEVLIKSQEYGLTGFTGKQDSNNFI